MVWGQKWPWIHQTAHLQLKPAWIKPSHLRRGWKLRGDKIFSVKLWLVWFCLQIFTFQGRMSDQAHDRDAITHVKLPFCLVRPIKVDRQRQSRGQSMPKRVPHLLFRPPYPYILSQDNVPHFCSWKFRICGVSLVDSFVQFICDFARSSRLCRITSSGCGGTVYIYIYIYIMQNYSRGTIKSERLRFKHASKYAWFKHASK